MSDWVWINPDGGSWNTGKSTDVGGLIVSLPPRTRPPRRVQIDEVDGRDGDIVTFLGYAAYDRPLTIGLYGDYDVDEILDYFAPKGQIIFSDEPERCYDYVINDAIELQRVIRFKKGVVTFHVQPYKHVPEYMRHATSSHDAIDITSFTDGVVTITNEGNVPSRPIVRLRVPNAAREFTSLSLLIDGNTMLTVSNPNSGAISQMTFDFESMEFIYLEGRTPMSLNRYVTGNPQNFEVPVGEHMLRVSNDTGTEISIQAERFMRWL